MKKYCLVCVQLLPVPVHLISDQYWHHTKGVRSHQSSLGVLKTIRGKGEKTVLVGFLLFLDGRREWGLFTPNDIVTILILQVMY